jgi:hypothetical protein
MQQLPGRRGSRWRPPGTAPYRAPFASTAGPQKLQASPEALAAHGALKAAGKLRLTVTVKQARQTLRPTHAAEGRAEEIDD